MNWHWEDRSIKQLFRQLRQEEEKAVPSFQEVLHGDKVSSRLEVFPLFRHAAAVITMLVLSVTLLLELSPVPLELEPMATASLSEWQSPTDFLLLSSEEELLTRVPLLQSELWWEVSEGTVQ